MKNRVLYLNRLIELKDKSLVKAITGVCRCGKSSLLSLFEEHLLSIGVKRTSIIRLNFELLEFDSIKDHVQLNEYIVKRISADNKTYIILDEVQLVSEWERAVNSLCINEKLDIYYRLQWPTTKFRIIDLALWKAYRNSYIAAFFQRISRILRS